MPPGEKASYAHKTKLWVVPGLRQDKPEAPETPREQAARFIQTLFESPDEPRIHAMLGLKTETGRKGEKRLQQKLVTLTFEGNTRKSYGQHVDDVPVLAHSHSMYTPTILYMYSCVVYANRIVHGGRQNFIHVRQEFHQNV